jgi:hypothetical protein
MAQNPVLTIQEKGDNIQFKEIRGQDQSNDVSEFTCGTMGRDCPMEDHGEKAEVSVYYNGPTLVVLKTHGHRGNSVEKRRLTLAANGNSLVMEVIPIEPPGKAEKLVFTKAQ